MARTKYPLPTIINPPDRLCVRVNVPNDIGHIQAFSGAILNLAQWISWQNDPTKRAKDVASVWKSVYFEMLEHLYDGDCQEDISSKCIYFPNDASFIHYYPQDPFTQPDYVPPGYGLPPFWVATGGLIGTDLRAGDVVSDFTRIPPPLLLPQMLIESGFPRIRIEFQVGSSGQAEVEIVLLKVPQGGIAWVVRDDDVGTSDFLDMATTDIGDFNELNDLLGTILDGRLVQEYVYQVVVTGTGNHHIDITLLPKIDLEQLIGYGCGFRSVTLCGTGVTGTMPQLALRLTAQCTLEYSTDGLQTFIPVTDWDTYKDLCFKGDQGEQGVQGEPGAQGEPGECEPSDCSPLNPCILATGAIYYFWYHQFKVTLLSMQTAMLAEESFVDIVAAGWTNNAQSWYGDEGMFSDFVAENFYDDFADNEERAAFIDTFIERMEGQPADLESLRNKLYCYALEAAGNILTDAVLTAWYDDVNNAAAVFPEWAYLLLGLPFETLRKASGIGGYLYEADCSEAECLPLYQWAYFGGDGIGDLEIVAVTCDDGQSLATYDSGNDRVEGDYCETTGLGNLRRIRLKLQKPIPFNIDLCEFQVHFVAMRESVNKTIAVYDESMNPLASAFLLGNWEEEVVYQGSFGVTSDPLATYIIEVVIPVDDENDGSYIYLEKLDFTVS